MCIAAVAASTTMQDSYAPAQYVHSRLALYYATVVDLRWSRAIHSCNECAILQALPQLRPAAPADGRTKQLCKAVHYGICSAVRLAQVPSNGPKTPVTPTPQVIPFPPS